MAEEILPGESLPGEHLPGEILMGSGGNMALPFGAKYVYKALGLPVPAEGHEDESPFPPSEFEDELTVAAAILQSDFPIGTYPCLYVSGIWNPTGNDLIIYEMALGLYTASLIVGTSTAAPGVGGPVMVKRKLVDIEYTFKNVDPADRGTGWQKQAYDLMGRTCSGDGLSGLDANAGSLFVVVNPKHVPLRPGFLRRRGGWEGVRN